jgi:uncharacterized protein DUF3631
LPAILADARADQTPPPQATTEGPSVNVLDLTLRLLEEHVAVTAEEQLAIALWILHTHVYDRFSATPRLALLSPTRECGKTSLLSLLETLVGEPYRSDNITSAAVFRVLDDRHHTTLLIDEVDNLGLLKNSILRSIFNAGHGRSGSVDRVIRGHVQKFNVFAPLAVAAIGDVLPMPLTSRAIVIRMHRYVPTEGQPHLRRVDQNDPALLAAREEIGKWARTFSLTDPEMPFRNRAADNWRVLISIADALGRGDEARMVAQALRNPDEDPAVVLLGHIRQIFLTRGVDRISSKDLVEALLQSEEWHWRGPRDDLAPHNLTQGEVAQMLRPFGIRPRTIWPSRERSCRGYMREWFERAWKTYCPGVQGLLSRRTA